MGFGLAIGRPEVGGNLWRTTGDIKPNWDRIYTIASAQAGLAAYAGPGHWNDPDMLEVGNGELTLAERSRTLQLVGHAGGTVDCRQRPGAYAAARY